MNVKSTIAEAIGNTPIVKINSSSKLSEANIYGKCEFLNPAHSVKDRIALFMIEDAIKEANIKDNTIVVEPTSGNTGIGLAMVCAAKQIKLILTMPSSMSIERRKLLSALGAKLELTDPQKGMKGAIAKAQEIHENTPNSFMPQQFNNPSNIKAHRQTTAQEIYKDMDGKIDIFLAAVGTGGSITGVGEVLKEKIPNIKIYTAEPINSPVLSGGNPGPHKIQGIGAGFVPNILNTNIYENVIKVDVNDAYKTSRRLAKQDGLIVGISAGANVWASEQIAKESKNKNILTILCDTGERYLSTELYELDQ